MTAAAPMPRVRVGVVGVGSRGHFLVHTLLTLDGVDVIAVCDEIPERVTRAQQTVTAAGRPSPVGYDRGPTDYERLCAQQNVDLVIVATPWEWHARMCVAAMRSGKHAATEVPAAVTVDECWELVETSETTRRHCVILENCCYDRREMLMLNLVRTGILGEILHSECSYQHDIRRGMLGPSTHAAWRRQHSMRRNGNLYPTHGLGPIAQCLNINRGNQLDHLVSMSSPSRGLQLWRDRFLAPDDHRRAENYVLGDVNLTLLQTIGGQTIYLVHDTNLPRPYSRINMIQGTNGLMQGWPDRIHIEDRSPPDAWEPLETWFEQYEHPLWRSDRIRQETGGHGGMDVLVLWRLITCLRQGTPTDINVYDAATWSCISELTERSVANRSRAMDIPDFTRGLWRTTPPLEIVEA